mmetsp:Transcript_7109/g.26144  ORF Transcript_7109/g.26144 Transcript_7109/m.26144 type:complete len:202 (-) Transcript_7109:549-1154(-)
MVQPILRGQGFPHHCTAGRHRFHNPHMHYPTKRRPHLAWLGPFYLRWQRPDLLVSLVGEVQQACTNSPIPIRLPSRSHYAIRLPRVPLLHPRTARYRLGLVPCLSSGATLRKHRSYRHCQTLPTLCVVRLADQLKVLHLEGHCTACRLESRKRKLRKQPVLLELVRRHAEPHQTSLLPFWLARCHPMPGIAQQPPWEESCQ